MKKFVLILILVVLGYGVTSPIFAASEVTTTNKAIDLIIDIPIIGCQKINENSTSGTLVECKGNLVTGIYNITGLLNVAFQFMIIAGLVIVTFMAILQGFKVLFYSPMASKVSEAKSSLLRYSTALLILIFAVVILNQIDPRLASPTSTITDVVVIKLCNEITDKAVCDENKASCTWYKDKCNNKNETPCDAATAQIDCKPNVCQWAGNKCVEVNGTSEIGCYQLNESEARCNSNPGCSPSFGCYPKDPKAIVYTEGRITPSPALNCYTFKTAATCPSQYCTFAPYGGGITWCYSEVQIAEMGLDKKPVGELCSAHEQCITDFCKIAEVGNGSQRKCSQKRTNNQYCEDDNWCATGLACTGVEGSKTCQTSTSSTTPPTGN